MHRLAPEWVFPSRVESAAKNSLHAFRLKIFLTGNYTLSVQPSWCRMENEPLFLPRRLRNQTKLFNASNHDYHWESNAGKFLQDGDP